MYFPSRKIEIHCGTCFRHYSYICYMKVHLCVLKEMDMSNRRFPSHPSLTLSVITQLKLPIKKSPIFYLGKGNVNLIKIHSNFCHKVCYRFTFKYFTLMITLRFR